MNLGLAVALSALIVFFGTNALTYLLPGHVQQMTADTINKVNRTICGTVGAFGLLVWIWSSVS